MPVATSSVTRFLRMPGRYVRQCPVTSAYLALLAVTHIVVFDLLRPATADRFLTGISTNLDNLEHRPLRVLFGSLLVADTRTTWLDNLLIIGGGVAVCLALLESRSGSLRAATVFVGGHLASTIVTAFVIAAAISAGRYPQSIRSDQDFGVSYGAATAATAIVAFLPRRVRPFWVAFVFIYPLTAADWHQGLPDFTTVGHLTAAAFGLVAAFWLSLSRGPLGQPSAKA